MLKRLFDIIGSIIGLFLLSPLFLLLSIWIKIDSKGPVFYRQKRVGKNGKLFSLFKFRSMNIGAEKNGLLTVGRNDSRITRSGFFIRKYKLDEFPQLINVLSGDMSIVGPRPEVPKYVALYNENQMKVLQIKPGISDWASIKFSNESELLEKSKNPEKFYLNEVMPQKLALNLKYVETKTIWMDFKIIFFTIKKILTG
jgi:lipopolysaccharide/colanic/teichoic acid biosynthesis glycosyltransferase